MSDITDTGEVVRLVRGAPLRDRLPNRRECVTETISDGRNDVTAAVGFDPETGRAREIFLSGAKAGTDIAAILDDAAVLISVALQHGVPAAALAHSISRAPTFCDSSSHGPFAAASVIGAALDLLVQYETGAA